MKYKYVIKNGEVELTSGVVKFRGDQVDVLSKCVEELNSELVDIGYKDIEITSQQENEGCMVLVFSTSTTVKLATCNTLTRLLSGTMMSVGFGAAAACMISYQGIRDTTIYEAIAHAVCLGLDLSNLTTDPDLRMEAFVSVLLSAVPCQLSLYAGMHLAKDLTSNKGICAAIIIGNALTMYFAHKYDNRESPTMFISV